MGENDEKISLLDWLIAHAKTTVKYNIYHGAGRDAYDTPAMRGRNGARSDFQRTRAVSLSESQQGYSPFSTWTRGLRGQFLGWRRSWNFALLSPAKRPDDVMELLEKAAKATADLYVEQATARMESPIGTRPRRICIGWENGGRGNAEPFNEHEPVDSTAAAIAAQGLLRLGRFMAGSRITLHGSRADGGQDVVRRPISGPVHGASGIAASFGLSSSQRMGFHSGWPEAFRARSRACGGIITRRSWRCTSRGSPRAAGRITHFLMRELMATATAKKVAMVTGGSRGIGLRHRDGASRQRV